MKHHPTSLTPRRAIVLLAFFSYHQQGAPLTSHEAQLLCYLLQRLGLSIKLDFEATPQGPYSDKLIQVLKHMRPDLLQAQLELGQDRPLMLEPLAIERARIMVKEHAPSTAMLHAIQELIEGMETRYGLWLLSCVDWLYHQQALRDAQALAATLSQPRPQRIQAQPHHVLEAFRRLSKQGLCSS